MAAEKFSELINLMARLRGPDGCPWDRAQNYDSVKGLLLEEAYEVVDAVSARDFAALEDELGDLLFQVVFYSRLAEEEGRFKFGDVVDRICAKLVRRHPHVFGDVVARTPEEALKSWNAVKETERRAVSKSDAPSASLLDGIPKSLPSTLEAFELGVRAGKAGFDWVKLEDLLDKVEEEVREIRQELKIRRPQESASRKARHEAGKIDEEVGDLMFSVANLARTIGSDPESCLRRANRKFTRRFQSLEREVRKRGKKLPDCSPEELESIWTTVKVQEDQ
ncbi:MAG TPA: nucleoside triphosphate pyrophosphohydrolase [Terriglobia bacterium]|nr:nucleoside triphosphate pyrophosphohydrolase [Terriglobia bacterium]